MMGQGRHVLDPFLFIVKRTPWKRKPPKEGTWNGFKRTLLQRSIKPLNKIGKQGKKNARADAISKRELVKKGIDCCQLCGRTFGLSRSHSNKRRHENDLTNIALLCIFPCHTFIEYELNSEVRREVNDFIIQTNLEGESKFEAVVKLIPEEKRAKFISAIMDYKG